MDPNLDAPKRTTDCFAGHGSAVTMASRAAGVALALCKTIPNPPLHARCWRQQPRPAGEKKATATKSSKSAPIFFQFFWIPVWIAMGMPQRGRFSLVPRIAAGFTLVAGHGVCGRVYSVLLL